MQRRVPAPILGTHRRSSALATALVKKASDQVKGLWPHICDRLVAREDAIGRATRTQQSGQEPVVTVLGRVYSLLLARLGRLAPQLVKVAPRRPLFIVDALIDGADGCYLLYYKVLLPLEDQVEQSISVLPP